MKPVFAQLESRVDRALDRPGRWLVVFALLLAMQINPWWRPTPDSAAYLSIARSIAEGAGPVKFGSPHLYYSPGYPLAISPAFLLSSRPFLCLSVFQWLLVMALMAGVFWWARRIFGRAGILVTGLVMVNVGLWEYFRLALSEILFTALLVWSVNVLTLASDQRERLRAAGFTALGMLLVMFLCLVRPVGVFVAAGFGVVLLVKAFGRKISWTRCFGQGFPVALLAVATVLAVIQYDKTTSQQYAGAETTYVDQVVSSASQVAEGARLRISEIGRLLLPGMFKSYGRQGAWLNINTILYLPVFGVVAAGWWKLVRRRPDILAWMFPFYLAFYVFVWSFDQGARFFTPMLPVLWACVAALLEGWSRRFTALACLLAVHFAVAIIFWGVWLKEAPKYDRNWPAVDSLAAAVQTDREAGAFLDDIGSVRWMLCLSMDRRWPQIGDGSAIDDGVHWLIAKKTHDPVNHFQVRREAGGMVLLERQTPQPTSQPGAGSGR